MNRSIFSKMKDFFLSQLYCGISKIQKYVYCRKFGDTGHASLHPWCHHHNQGNTCLCMRRYFKGNKTSNSEMRETFSPKKDWIISRIVRLSRNPRSKSTGASFDLELLSLCESFVRKWMGIYSRRWISDVCVLRKLGPTILVSTYEYKYLWSLASSSGCKRCSPESLSNVRLQWCQFSLVGRMENWSRKKNPMSVISCGNKRPFKLSFGNWTGKSWRAHILCEERGS